MSGITPYLFFDGNAASALEFYRSVFGGELVVNTYADFGRTDGPGTAVAHGMLRGDVALFAADAGPDQEPLALTGALFALLGTAPAGTLEEWFAALAVGGEVVDALQRRPWGDHDGQVRDRFGITWLIGYQG